MCCLVSIHFETNCLRNTPQTDTKKDISKLLKEKVRTATKTSRELCNLHLNLVNWCFYYSTSDTVAYFVRVAFKCQLWSAALGLIGQYIRVTYYLKPGSHW